MLLIPASALAQAVNEWPASMGYEASNTLFEFSDFGIEIDTIAEDIGVLSDADLTGFSTYRLYVTTTDSTDQLSAVYGNIDEPSQLNCTGGIFQSQPVGAVTPEGVLPGLWELFPSNAYDSFVTIGIDQSANSELGEGSINILESSQTPWTSTFEPGGGALGSGFSLNDATGGSWFILPSFVNGIAGADQRILIAQITTDGTLSGNLHVQIFLGGDNLNGTVYLNLPIAVGGCTDPEACNYDNAAEADNGSCTYPAVGLDCDGTCLLDEDGDGTCDENEISGCTDPAASNFNEEATEDDGTCKVFGCTDMNAVNYDPTATDDDGSCQHLCTAIAGCAYPDAENYNPVATCDNGTCTFGSGTLGTCSLDQDDNGFIGSYDLIFFLTLYGLPCSE